MRSVDRDQAIERALKHALQADPSRTVEACPDAETVAAWAARALPDGERQAVEAHLADCLRCQALVAAFSRSEPEPATPPSRWTTWRWPWLIPVATAATAVAIWVATPEVPLTTLESIEQNAVPSAETGRSDRATAPAATDFARETAQGERDAPPAAARKAATSELQARKLEESPAAPPPAAAEERAQAVVAETGRVAGAADAAAPAAPPPAVANRAAAADQVAAPTAAAAPAAAPARQEALQRFRAVAPVEIVSPDPAVRWRITAAGGVERTTSGGSTWTAVPIAPPAVVTAGASPDPQICWLVGRAGAVRLSTDGVQFRALVFPEAVDFSGVRATSSRSAVVTAADGRTFRTDDQGATWSVVPQ